MEAFVWDQNFVTGLGDVDEQHLSLVDLFNELNDALFGAARAQDQAIKDIFDRLVVYAGFHFAEEEALMLHEQLDPRHVTHHKQLHQQFLAQVSALWAAHASMSDPSEQFVGFLTSWLGLHILGVDQSMARQIEAIRRGNTPQAAFELESNGHNNSAQALLKMVGRLYHVLSEQNSQLAQANAQLEDRVRLRTHELQGANEALTLANRQLEVFSRTDGLLQIANRKCFDDRLVEESARASRSHQSLGLLMIDVDYFKRYNDRYGHQAGDHCLQAVARAVSQAVMRPSDLVARYGGEELVVLLPDTDEAGTLQVAKKICAAVAALALPHEDSSVVPYVTVSVGAAWAMFSAQGGGVGLLARADQALYQAKETGRNRVCVAPG